MDRVAVFVDAGYLFAQGSAIVAGSVLHRDDMHLDADAAIAAVSAHATRLSGVPLLRVYWYDAAVSAPTPQQLALAHRANLKLRLGTLNQQGHQKGVDTLLVTDLLTLARNRAIADAVLVSGDEDLRVGVAQAQELGVRVHLLGIEPAWQTQSASLMQEADTIHELTRAEIETFLRCAEGRGAPRASTGEAWQQALGERVAGELTTEEQQALVAGPGLLVPPEIDAKLLSAGSRERGGPLSSDEKRALRVALVAACRARQ
ncbi:MAG: NYN domain-containing protein [Polyangiales bacterium]